MAGSRAWWRSWWDSTFRARIRDYGFDWFKSNWFKLISYSVAASTAGAVAAAAALGAPINASCATLVVERGDSYGAASIDYVWGRIGGEPHAIFQANGLVYAIPSNVFRDSDGTLTNAHALPAEALPAEAIPAEALPAEAIPAEILPAGALPASAIPSNAIPSNAIPSNLLDAAVVADAMQQLPAGGFLSIPLPDRNEYTTLNYTFGREEDGSISLVAAFNGAGRAIPKEAIPRNAADLAIPSNAIPSNIAAIEAAWQSLAIPSNAIPSNAIPAEAIPSNALAYAIPSNLQGQVEQQHGDIPSNGIPSNLLSADLLGELAIPSNAIPAEAIPSNAIPSNAIPSNVLPPVATDLKAAIPNNNRLGSFSREIVTPNAVTGSGQFVSTANPGFKFQSEDDGIVYVPVDGDVERLLNSDPRRRSRLEILEGLPEFPLTAVGDALDDCRQQNREDWGHNWGHVLRGSIAGCLSDQTFFSGVGCIDNITATVYEPEDYDFDDDGFTENEGDCAPRDATIYPGADEVLDDDIDQDCDGFDEKSPAQEFGCHISDPDCDGYNEAQGDCAPNDGDIHPGAPEIYGDGIDNDCDGVVDEGFLFTIGPEVPLTTTTTSGAATTTTTTSGSATTTTTSGTASTTTSSTSTTTTTTAPTDETVHASIDVYGDPWIHESGSGCVVPNTVEIDLYVSIEVDGQPVEATPANVQSATMSWSPVMAGSKPMSYYGSIDLWTAILGPFPDGSVTGTINLNVTVSVVTTGGASDSDSAVVQLRLCSGAP